MRSEPAGDPAVYLAHSLSHEALKLRLTGGRVAPLEAVKVDRVLSAALVAPDQRGRMRQILPEDDDGEAPTTGKRKAPVFGRFFTASGGPFLLLGVNITGGRKRKYRPVESELLLLLTLKRPATISGRPFNTPNPLP